MGTEDNPVESLISKEGKEREPARGALEAKEVGCVGVFFLMMRKA